MKNLRNIKYVVVLLLLNIVVVANAATTLLLQNKEFNVDTLSHVNVGPGTVYTSLTLSSPTKSFNAFVMTLDLKNNDNVEYRMEIGRDTTLSTERISSIAKRKSDNNTHYFAGINADFYITTSYVAAYAGQPHMDCIMNGEIASTGYLAASDYGHFFMDYDKNVWCDNPTQSFEITYPDGTKVSLPRINQDIYDNEIVLFNSKYGKQTRVSGCTDVQLVLAEGESWVVNKPIKLVVVSAPSTSGCTPIAKNGAVLSANGTYAEKVASLKVGDVLVANFNITLQDYGVSPQIKECSGGDVVILKRGEVVYEAHRFINGINSNNPRTMAGYTEDRSKMVWCCVDGRSNTSAGCTYPEGAELMKFLGCYDAVNFDGGGSTGMYIEPLGIVNSPSDGSERAVANGLFAVAKTPTDNEIAEIRFVDWVKEMPQYGYYTPKFYGYNKYGLLINTDLKGVTLSCPAELGEIVKDGTTLFCNGGGTHALTATYNGISTTLAVSVDDKTEPIFRHPQIMLDTYKDYTIDVYGVVRGADVTIDNAAFTWETSDASIVTVDEAGNVKGISNGKATIKGTVGSFSKEIGVTVEIPTKHYQDITSYDGWTIEVSNLSGQSISPMERGGFAIDYTADASRKIYLTIAKDVNSWSRPDSLIVEVNPGTSSWKALTINFADYRTPDELVSYEFAPNLMANAVNRISIPMSEIVDINDMSTYPLTFKNLYVVLSDSKGSSHHVEINKLAWVYNVIPADASSVENIENDKIDLVLSPNPVLAGEDVKLNVSKAVEYTVSAMSGAVVNQGKGVEISTAGLSSGVYLVTVKTMGGLITSKLIVK